MKQEINLLNNLFNDKFNEKIEKTEKLPKSGSPRRYYRFTSQNHNVIGTYNVDFKENVAFLVLSEHFLSKDLSVPKIYARDVVKNVYLQEDLGDETLFDRIKILTKNNDFPEELIDIYKSVLDELAKFQVYGREGLDYAYCYPRSAFDKQSMMWDLNYFKYFFLKLADVQFDEQLLEDDFTKLVDFLFQTETNYFLYRDFQSRNIMLKDDKIFFIDYQGGRRGALHYDVVSLLYDAKANIPDDVRLLLKDYYIETIQKHVKIDVDEFDKYYHGFVLIRIFQAMGAYGYRGFFERKTHFLQSIPYALKNISNLLADLHLPVELPELIRILKLLPESEKLKKISNSKDTLKVSIKSFSYKKEIPKDLSGNGGGFVFDCRFLDNPGRINKYKTLCGKDKEVIEYLENKKEIKEFLKSVFKITKSAVKNYRKRKFTNLAINFGCTGGQHRSVYFAEKTSEFLQNKFDIIVDTEHTEGF